MSPLAGGPETVISIAWLMPASVRRGDGNLLRLRRRGEREAEGKNKNGL